MMKALTRFAGILVIFGISATAGLAPAKSQETIKLRLGSGHPAKVLEANIVTTQWYVPELIKRVKEKTGKTLEVQQFHGGTVAKLKEVFEATRDGLLDIGSWYTVFEPTNAFLQTFNFYLPFNSPDPKLVTKATQKTFDKFPQLASVFEEKHNQKLLSISCVGNYGLGTSFAWKNFSDLKGHKLAGAGANLNWIKGATPVSSNLNEAYNAIQTGVYEGYIIFPGSWYGFKLHEVGKYFTKTDFGAMAIHAMTINLNKWKKLDKDVQNILIEMGKEFSNKVAEECVNFGIKGEAKLKSGGVTISQITPKAKAEWCEAVKEFPNKMAQDANNRGLPGSEVMRYYITTIENMGYKFPCKYEIK